MTSSSCSYICLYSPNNAEHLTYVVPRLKLRIVGYLLIVLNPSLFLLLFDSEQEQCAFSEDVNR